MTDTNEYEARSWGRTLAWIGGALLLFFAICPSFSVRGGGSTEETRVRIGVPFSPLYVHERTRLTGIDETGMPTVMIQSRSEFSFLSLSMGALVTSVALLAIACALSKEARRRAV
jgi:hypothetical protein